MKRSNKKGFTIVELVIVIAVIGILAAVLIPTFSSVVEKANESAAMQEAKNAMTEDLAMANADYAKIGSTVDGYTFKGSYADNTYTYTTEDYICTYNTQTGVWSVEEKTATP